MMMPFRSLGALFYLCTVSTAFVVNRDHSDGRRLPTRCFVSSPPSSCTSVGARIRISTLQETKKSATEKEVNTEELFQELCQAVNVLPCDNVRLQTVEQPDGGGTVRGVYLNQPVRAGDVILSVPLSACLRDDEPPEWLDCNTVEEEDSAEPCLVGGYYYNPSQWASRLAASLLDDQLDRQESYAVDRSTDLWLSLLPDPDFLRASLPIHWSPAILQSAYSTALEVAVDSAYFARVQAVQELTDGLVAARGGGSTSKLSESDAKQLAENALDVVQTRSCRVILHNSNEEEQEDTEETWAPALRVLAPVFDFINHPSKGKANAEFVLEQQQQGGDGGEQQQRVVVRALQDLNADQQVLIDYGDSARPAHKCLASYGFVPGVDAVNEDDHVAEVYIDGVRYEVSSSSIPEELVEAMLVHNDVDNGVSLEDKNFEQKLKEGVEQEGQQQKKQQVVLTPDIADQLANRISAVAYQLLLDPLERYYDEDQVETPHDVLSAQLAASLRWNQHRILLKCSEGLLEWAVGQRGTVAP